MRDSVSPSARHCWEAGEPLLTRSCRAGHCFRSGKAGPLSLSVTAANPAPWWLRVAAPFSIAIEEMGWEDAEWTPSKRALTPYSDTVATHYDLGHWWDVQPVGAAFRIAAEAGEFKVGVVSEGRSDASLRFEAMLLTHLADKAYTAPRLVRTGAAGPGIDRRPGAGSGHGMGPGWRGGLLPGPASGAERPGAGGVPLRGAFVPAEVPSARGPTLFTLEQDGPDRPRGVHRNCRLASRRRRASAPPECIVIPVAPIPPVYPRSCTPAGEPFPVS